MSKHAVEPTMHESEILGYSVLYERTATGWCAYMQDLPTVIGAAPTLGEVEQQMREAVPAHLEALKNDRVQRPWLYTTDKLSPELRAVFERIDAA